MTLTYYDDVTPKNYEPPGFTSTLFDLNNLFHGEGTMKHMCGTTISPFHSYQFKP